MGDADEFAYIVSHDLKEPLRNIINFVELIEKHPVVQQHNDVELAFLLNVLSNSAVEMDTLIRDLVQYARTGREKNIQKVDCNELALAAIHEMGVLIAASHCQVSATELPVVTADPQLFKQVLKELLSNAIKFSKRDEPAVVKIACKEGDRQWTFSVSDNGIGIADVYWNKIFSVFKRLHPKEAYEGTGMGLAICKKIMLLHGGDICVDSLPGKGTVVYFTIPK